MAEQCPNGHAGYHFEIGCPWPDCRYGKGGDSVWAKVASPHPDIPLLAHFERVKDTDGGWSWQRRRAKVAEHFTPHHPAPAVPRRRDGTCEFGAGNPDCEGRFQTTHCDRCDLFYCGTCDHYTQCLGLSEPGSHG